MTSLNNGDFAPSLAGLVQQQQVQVSTAVTGGIADVQKDGTTVDAAVRSKLNFISGTNTTLTVTDNAGSDRVDVTIAARGFLDYDTRKTDLTTTGTSYATGVDVLSSALSFTADGTSDYLVEISGETFENLNTADYAVLAINLDGAQGSRIAQTRESSTSSQSPLYARGILFAPSAGTHTVNVRLHALDGGTAQITAGDGTGTNITPILVTVKGMA